MGSRSINKLTGLDSSSEMREKVVVMMIVFINPVSVSISVCMRYLREGGTRS